MNRSSYQKQMDALHVPKEKADETLKMMLEENRRLREAEENRRASQERKRRLPAYLLAAAACLMLVLFGVRGLGGSSAFRPVNIGGLPAAAVSRGEEERMLSFEETFGCAPDALFAGCTVTEDGTAEKMLQGKPAHEARLTLLRDGTTFSAAVTDYEPPLLTVLKKDAKTAASGIFLAKDTENAASLYAALEREGRFVVLHAEGMSEDGFQKAAATILKGNEK